MPVRIFNYNNWQSAAIDGYIDKYSRVINEKDRLGSDVFFKMLASEKVLRNDWDSPEEDEAWENL